MIYGYGVDLGGTAVKIGLFGDGALLDRWEIKTDLTNGGEGIPGIIARSVLSDMERRGIDEILGLGIGVPGQVWGDGTVDAENLDWVRFPLIPRLREATGLAVAAENDANAAALGEYRYGGGRGYDSLLFVTLGTGVGGGIIAGGRCLSGAHRAGGELGHIQVEPGETRPCACGNLGCLEQYASATGCARMAREALESSGAPSALRKISSPDARAVWDAAKSGDELALAVAEKTCMYLARGLAAAACVADPEVILIGGGMSNAGRMLADMTRRHFRKLAFNACRDTPILLASLGSDAGIYGGYALLDTVSG